MKIISIWQPWATLLLHGLKLYETRGWPAPSSLIGQRIGIASTKQLKPEQLAAVATPRFQSVYATTGLPPLTELPRGCILGTALLRSSEIMTAESMAAVTATERLFGYWTLDRYAWRLDEPVLFGEPIRARGGQGFWNFDHEAQGPAVQGGEADAR